MTRLLHIAVGFAAVFAAYWVYRLAAVPWIEPSIKTGRAGEITSDDKDRIREGNTERVALFRDMFPPGSWELNNPNILKSDRAMLLMEKYRNLGDGRVDLWPCTLILWPDDSVVDPQQRRSQAVILESPDGALLEFDRPLDLSDATTGRLIGGQLKGRVTIRSKGKLPGAEDDLWIVTRDVELSEQHVWTPHAVDFRYGRHYGRGRQMHIKLLAGEDASGNQRGPNVAGIELFEMAHVERLHLELGKKKGPKDAVAPGSRAGLAALPIEISCQGPFQFNVVGKLITFRDRVDVMRINPTGPADQMSCEVLAIFLADRKRSLPAGPPPAGKPQKTSPGAFDLEAQRIEAQGTPVAVSAPSERLQARGQRLEYDLTAERISLGGPGEVMLQQGPNEIHAQSLEYESAGPGRLGRVEAKGPGWLRGRMDDRPNEQLEARWNDALRVRPDDQNHVVSLTGGALLTYGAIGRLDAREVHFWLRELPPKPNSDQPQLRPDRMLARDKVHVDSQRLSCAVDQLELWFEQTAQTGTSPAEVAGTRRVPSAEAETGTRRVPAASQTVTAPVQAPQPAQHFEIVGRLLQGRLLMHPNRQSDLSDLIVEDRVEFTETETARPDEQPLRVLGDRLHVVDANRPHAAVTVVGQPAHFEGRGLALTGPSIHLNRGTNRLAMEGEGRMDLPIRRDLQGQPLPTPGTLSVQWARRMTFDGRTACFEESVTAVGAQQRLHTETLEVRFREPIRFADDAKRQDPEAEWIHCKDGVHMESQTVENEKAENGKGENRKTGSFERLEVADLTVNLLSGAVNAEGPGWLASVRPAGSLPEESLDERGPSPEEPLRCLHVCFQGGITGNLRQREMSFHDHVQTAYAPVNRWDAMLDVNDPDSLGPQGVVMRCDRLTVNQMSTPVGDRRAMELEAAGNAVVEGRGFTGRAIRMTYGEAKDMLVLEGDGRNAATLFRQQQVGGPMSKAAAQKIVFWPKTKRVAVQGGQSVELDQVSLPTPDGPAPSSLRP